MGIVVAKAATGAQRQIAQKRICDAKMRFINAFLLRAVTVHCGERCFKTKKAPASSPDGHDYRQPKLEEGTGALWQVRKGIVMSSITAVYSAVRRCDPGVQMR